jgi:glycosyltransferase involved in cell wall biosynthesis
MNTTQEPAVTVIVCTYNRPEMLPRAIASVLAQDFEDFEVVVVDDGSDPPADVSAFEDERLHVIHTEHRGVGAARAEGLHAARGELVAYCDDDDTWSHRHLAQLLAYLTEHPGIDLVYADSEWIYQGQHPLVLYSIDFDVFELINANYIFATDVMHRREAATRAGGFDRSLTAHEDWDLWLRMSQHCVLRHLEATLAAHHWHEDCLSELGLWDQWERARNGHLARIESDGFSRRSGTGRGQPRFNRDTWNQARRELVWQSSLRAEVGYGSVARNLVLALERAGIDIAMAPFGNQPVKGFERFFKLVDAWDRLAFYCDHRFRPGDMTSEHLVIHTMWETTGVPVEQVDAINQTSKLLYVPCRQNVTSYRESGVKVPVKVLRYGVDGCMFPHLQRARANVFTFGTFGDLIVRKGIDVLIRAFRDEFHRREPVRLILKSTGPIPAYAADDVRIQLVSGVMGQGQLLDLLREMDVLVLPSRGEGFGLCGIEAMATGMPLIATNWSGPAEYLSAEDSYPLSYRMVDSEGCVAHEVRFSGLWAEPDYEHLRNLLRWTYEHPDETAEKGRLASERIHRDWTWDHAALQVREDLDELVASGFAL